jgi:hypothetical protein
MLDIGLAADCVSSDLRPQSIAPIHENKNDKNEEWGEK